MKRLALLSMMAATSAQAGEVTTGMSLRTDGFTGGEHWELTGYTESRRWRYGVTYTETQRLNERRLHCGSLGSLGEICVPRDVVIDPYASGYVQRLWSYRAAYVGFGLAVHPVREPLHSLPASFRTSFGYRFDQSWSVEWTHMSNAGMKSPNWGQDLLLIRYEW